MATVLIADDDPIVREIACEMLRARGHVLLVAEDGLEAVRLLETQPIDLLITDMLMPNMDGVEVIRAARIRHPALKVLAISGGGSVGATYMLHMAKVLGADATLEKPLRLDALVNAIDDILYDRLRGRVAKAGSSAGS